MTKVLILEVLTSHTECLPAQFKFLEGAGVNFSFLGDEQVKNRVEGFSKGVDLHFDNFNLKGWKTLWKKAGEIRDFIVENKYTHVIFNSAQNKLLTLLCLRLPASMLCFGIIHSLHNIRWFRFSQLVIVNRLNGLLVINDYLLKSPKVRKRNISSFYPIYYPDYRTTIQPPEKEAGEIWIAIPGKVELKRRNYHALLPALEKASIRYPLKFILIGDSRVSDGPVIRRLIEERHIEKYFTVLDYYPDDAELHVWLKQSDVLMPLIHPGYGKNGRYLDDRASGNFNLAFAHKLPLLMHHDFEKHEDFRENGIFYTPQDLGTVLENLPAYIMEKSEMYTAPKWKYEFQQERYLRFLGLKR